MTIGSGTLCLSGFPARPWKSRTLGIPPQKKQKGEKCLRTFRL